MRHSYHMVLFLLHVAPTRQWFWGKPKIDTYDMDMEVPYLEDLIITQKIDVTLHSDIFNQDLPIRILGIVGVENKGKTWFLNELLGKNFPLSRTESLRVTYSEERGWLALDTPGTLPTVSQAVKAKRIESQGDSFEQSIGAQNINMQKRREQLLLDIVSKLSDLVVFLVGDLTWHEQSVIHGFYQNYVLPESENGDTDGHSRDTQQHAQMIVVHNFQTISSISEAHDVFSKQIGTQYDGNTNANVSEKGCRYQQKFEGRPSDLKKNEKDPPSISHVCFVQKTLSSTNTEAASMNKETIDWFRNTLAHSVMAPETRRLCDVFQEQLGSVLNKYLELETVQSADVYDTSHETIAVNFECGGKHTDKYPVHLDVSIDNRNKKLQLKRNSAYREFLEEWIIETERKFRKPSPNIYELHDHDETGEPCTYMYFQIEVPGVHEGDYNIIRKDDGNLYVHVKRVESEYWKSRNKDSQIINDELFGQYDLQLPFNTPRWDFRRGEGYEKLEDGMLTLRAKRKAAIKVSVPSTASATASKKGEL